DPSASPRLCSNGMVCPSGYHCGNDNRCYPSTRTCPDGRYCPWGYFCGGDHQCRPVNPRRRQHKEDEVGPAVLRLVAASPASAEGQCQPGWALCPGGGRAPLGASCCTNYSWLLCVPAGGRPAEVAPKPTC